MERIPDSNLYTSLDSTKRQVRLLHLQSGTSNELIECILEKVNLESKPRFEALSYEWGDARMFQPEIKLGGTLVSIRNNLWWALHHLRHESKSRTLWIDALCVNQDDISERSQQVAQMKSIYSEASKVILWIGREEHPEGIYLYQETRMAINFLKVLYHDSIENYPFLTYSVVDKVTSITRTLHTSKWDAILKLCNRSYWHRLWIIQEVILASDLVIQCGNELIPWDYLSRLCIRVSKSISGVGTLKDSLSKTHAYRIATHRMDRTGQLDSFGYYKTSIPLVILLEMFENSVCQDERDKVFGLLSLCKTCCRDSVQADYSLNLIAVCTKLLEHHITCHCTSSGEISMAIADQILFSVGLAPISYRDDVPIPPNSTSLRYVKSSLLLPIVARDLGNVIYIGSNEVSTHSPLSICTEQEALTSYEHIIRYMLYYRGQIYHFSPKSDFRFPLHSKRGCEIAKPLSAEVISKQPSVESELRIPRILDSFEKENIQGIASTGTSDHNLVSHEKSVMVEFKSIVNFLRQISQDCAPLLRQLEVVVFLTSTGIFGCATEGIKLGDRALSFTGRWDGSWGRLGFLSQNAKADEWTGKGIAVSPDHYFGRFDLPSIDISEHKVRKEIDAATLMYFSGYF